MKPTRSPQDERPACIDGVPAAPQLDPRPMPALMLACPAPLDGAAQRYRRPLWRKYEKPESG